ncbi:hypothetical protein [Fibrella forsythiae]|uniref:Four helix bundle protein n=1 Tax=Fibrella forsythiae TaxID=2817061 RepID=A0ABS3JSF3_9BACT|nr:hypothetical protein [Fibrella forsythiae]MBO0952940.1 hypothetical protein [Fibrella forsythiae]
MEDDLRQIIHNFRSISGLICCAIDLLEGKLTEPDRKEFRDMLGRNLLYAQSMLTDLSSSKWAASAFYRSDELLIESSRLLNYLHAKNRNNLPDHHQKQMASLIQTLLFIRNWQAEVELRQFV